MRYTRPGCCRIPTAGKVALMLAMSLLTCPAVGQDEAGGQSNPPVAIGSGPLTATIEAETLRVENLPNGSTTRSWQPATRLSAGDEVYYTIRVHNPGKHEVTGIVVTKRLPFGVHYMRGSAAGPACEVQFSIDGGTTFTVAERLGVGADGKSRRKVAASEYTHVRWLLSRPLAAGATALLRFRATFS